MTMTFAMVYRLQHFAARVQKIILFFMLAFGGGDIYYPPVNGAPWWGYLSSYESSTRNTFIPTSFPKQVMIVLKNDL